MSCAATRKWVCLAIYKERRRWATAVWVIGAGVKECKDAFLGTWTFSGLFLPGYLFSVETYLYPEGAKQKSFSSRRVEKVDQGSKKSVQNSEFLGSHGTQGWTEANGLNLEGVLHQQRGEYSKGNGPACLMGFMPLRGSCSEQQVLAASFWTLSKELLWIQACSSCHAGLRPITAPSNLMCLNIK